MRALIVTGVLGAGTAVVFAIAALTATLFPNGTVVSSGWNGGAWMAKDGWGGGAVPMPVPMPAVEAPMRLDDGFAAPNAGFEALPGDVVITVDGEPEAIEPAP
jgi:hypothetical protein